ncbi:MAG TPA: acetylxylan esterase [Thermomicrobiales bacterium]|nr:acetylxylan esterase [Thermomicrobiales bacterium]
MSESQPAITEENEPTTASEGTSDAPHAPSGRPDDLDAWWDAIDNELAALPANPEFTVSPLQTNEHATVYTVRMTSIDNYPIAAWFSVPTGEGPFPALVTATAYASVVVPAHYDVRQRFVTMTMMTRGQRGADKPYAAAYPGHLTNGIASPDTYVFRGVMADMLRAYEVLRDHPAVDGERIGVTGTDAALLLAARRPGVKAVQVTATFWYRLAEMAAGTEAYPYEEINDYLRTFPEDREAVGRTLAYLDPQYQADRVAASVHISRDQESGFASDAWLANLVGGLDTDVAYYDVSHEGQTDHDALDAWMSAQLGVEPAPRIWQAEEIGPWR